MSLHEFEGLLCSSGWTLARAEETNSLYAVFTLAGNPRPSAAV